MDLSDFTPPRSPAGPRLHASASASTIAAVERDTGLSKDLLRVWERRYGFPTPQRNAAGERAYAPEQVARLRIVKRLLDAGHRPGRVLQLGTAELQALAVRTAAADDRHLPADGSGLADDERQQLLLLLRRHDLPALGGFLQRQLDPREHVGETGAPLIAASGLQRAAALNAAVDDASLRGQLEPFEERAYRQQLQSLLRAAMVQHDAAAGATVGACAHDRAGAAPRVLLATLPGEPQETGLLLVQALLLSQGCTCIALGTQLATRDIARAADAYRVDIVTLAFGGTLAPKTALQGLTELRGSLAPAAALWAAGGLPVLQRRRVARVQPLPASRDLLAALAEWRAQQAQQAQQAVGAGQLEPAGTAAARMAWTAPSLYP